MALEVPTIRFVVKRKEKGFKGRTRFAGSYSGAESMYETQGAAQCQAKNVGDIVYRLDLSNMGKGVSAEVVFVREPKQVKAKVQRGATKLIRKTVEEFNPGSNDFGRYESEPIKYERIRQDNPSGPGN